MPTGTLRIMSIKLRKDANAFRIMASQLIADRISRTNME
jgi:hypothetical protein